MANIALKGNPIHPVGEIPKVSATRIRTALAIEAPTYRSGFVTLT